MVRRIPRPLGASMTAVLCLCLGKAPALSAPNPLAPGGQDSAPAAEDGKLQSELLLDVVFDKGQASNVGSRVVVPVLGGTFEGPKLKGTIAGPAGDWIVARPDGSSVLDLRLMLQTDDDQKILMTCRGIAYTMPGGGLFARITPMFETASAKYAWLNNVVAVGVYRSTPGKIAYRVYKIL